MARRPIILSLMNMHESGMCLLRASAEVRMASAVDPATLQREVVGADALIVRTGGEVNAALLDCGKDLKVIGRHGVGYDQIDVEAATERGIQVVYTPGANTESVCEHVFAMMIGLSKHFPRMTAELAAGNYLFRTKMTGRDLFGRHAGHPRLRPDRPPGRGGGARRLQDEGPLQRHRPDPPRGRGPRRRPAGELRGGARGVGVRHAPRPARRQHVAHDRPRGAGQDAPRRDPGQLRRGSVVVESAVAEALDAGRLWGYASDVFEVEPPPADHPLIGRPDVLLTPHSAAQTVEGLSNMASGIAQDVLGVLRGEPPRNPVNDRSLVNANRRRLGLAALSS